MATRLMSIGVRCRHDATLDLRADAPRCRAPSEELQDFESLNRHFREQLYAARARARHHGHSAISNRLRAAALYAEA